MKKSSRTQTLLQRLHEACFAMDTISKSGHNEHFNYNYARAEEVFAPFREALKCREILIIPEDKVVKWDQVPTRTGPTFLLCTISVEYSFVDVSGQKEEPIKIRVGGAGGDFAGHGYGMAKTSALKYLIRDMSALPWAENEGPGRREMEQENSAVDSLTDPAVFDVSNHNRSRVTLGPSRKQSTAWGNAVVLGGKTAQQVADFLRIEFKVARIQDVPRNDIPRCIDWAGGRGDLVKDLESSLQVIKPKGGPQSVIAIAEAERSDETEVG